MPKINFNNTTPVAPSGKLNLQWQQQGDQVSANYQDLNPRLTSLENGIAELLATFCIKVENCA